MLQVRRAIARLLTPALQSKEFVHTELLRIAGQCAPSDIARFPALQVRLHLHPICAGTFSAPALWYDVPWCSNPPVLCLGLLAGRLQRKQGGHEDAGRCRLPSALLSTT